MIGHVLRHSNWFTNLTEEMLEEPNSSGRQPLLMKSQEEENVQGLTDFLIKKLNLWVEDKKKKIIK